MNIKISNIEVLNWEEFNINIFDVGCYIMVLWYMF